MKFSNLGRIQMYKFEFKCKSRLTIANFMLPIPIYPSEVMKNPYEVQYYIFARPCCSAGAGYDYTCGLCIFRYLCIKMQEDCKP